MRNKVNIKERHLAGGLPVDAPSAGAGPLAPQPLSAPSFTVVQARELGMCFGVRDALALTHAIQTPVNVTVFGQLVHNPIVTQDLADKGFTLSSETDRPDTGQIRTPSVLITAHGVSNAQRASFLEAGLHILDTTCPLVKKAHDAALALARQDRHILVIGKPGHVEVMGLTGDLTSYEIISCVDDVRHYSFSRLGVIAQTTTTDELFDAILTQVKAKNPHADTRAIRTVCQPTRDRQLAVQELLDVVDALIVVGGENSNNSRMLAQAAARRAKPFLLISSPHALHLSAVMALLPPHKPLPALGLTAGTSTLDETLSQVHQKLQQFAQPCE